MYKNQLQNSVVKYSDFYVSILLLHSHWPLQWSTEYNQMVQMVQPSFSIDTGVSVFSRSLTSWFFSSFLVDLPVFAVFSSITGLGDRGR